MIWVIVLLICPQTLKNKTNCILISLEHKRITAEERKHMSDIQLPRLIPPYTSSDPLPDRNLLSQKMNLSNLVELECIVTGIKYFKNQDSLTHWPPVMEEVLRLFT